MTNNPDKYIIITEREIKKGKVKKMLVTIGAIIGGILTGVITVTVICPDWLAVLFK